MGAEENENVSGVASREKSLENEADVLVNFPT